MSEPLYTDEVDVWVKSVISGTHYDIESLKELARSNIGILREFAIDDDTQYVRVCSTNIGMIRTYQKRFNHAEVTDE